MSTVRDRFDAFTAQLKPSQAKEPKQADPPGVIPESLVKSAKLAAWIAFAVLVYFLWLYTLDIAKDRAAPLYISHAGQWIGEIKFWFPYIVGFAGIAVGIPYVAKIAIPVFMSMTWRENLWPKAWSLFIAIAVSLVVIAGTFTVQGETIIESGRESAVAVAQAGQERAGLEASIVGAEAELKTMMDNRNAYLAQAASVGAAEWERSYVQQARREKDARLPQIERALGAARAADAKREEIKALRQQLARSTTTEALVERVETPRNAWIGATLDWLEGARAMLLALVMDIVCLLMPWIALRLEQARARQLAMVRGETFVMGDGRPAWADESHMIRDHRAEAKAEPAPMDAAYQGDVIYDGNTGDEMSWVEGYVNKRQKWVPGHYRKTGKKKPVVVDDVGVVLESDSRAARSEAMAAEVIEEPERSESEVEAKPSEVTSDVAEAPAEEGAAPSDLYAQLGLTEAAPYEVVDYGVEYGPPKPEKLPNGEGVMIAAE